MQEIIKTQLNWHAKSLQGCLYAAYAFKNDRSGTKLLQKVLEEGVNKKLVSNVYTIINKSISNPEVNYVSLIIPAIDNRNKLVDFISLLKENTSWHIYDDTIYKGKKVVKIRVPLGEKDQDDKEIVSWALFFAPMDFLPPTRQSPYFEMVVLTKSKYFLKEKYNRYSLTKELKDSIDRSTSTDDAHLADIYIKDITDNPRKDEKLWAGSSKRKKQLLTENNKIAYDDTLAKAKVTISYPVDE